MSETPPIVECSENQRRIYIDASHIHEAYSVALRAARRFKGGMHWKRYLPSYKFKAAELRMFPRDVVQSAWRQIRSVS